MWEVDVIIPVYQPGERFWKLLLQLKKQTYPIHKIFLINTEKEFFDRWIEEKGGLPEGIEVSHIRKQDFDHGETRNKGVSMGQSPFFLFLTDDAVPADEYLVERMLSPFADERVGMSYARQVPAPGCGVIESYTRSFNYPEQSYVKTAADMKTLGIKAFFASNVCAAYRRTVFEKLGGFTEHVIFNEDMIYARRLLDAGYGIAYAAEARVEHSHNYTGMQQLRRNFDLGVSHAQFPQIFGGLATESEGIRLVLGTCSWLCRIKKPWLIGKLIWLSGCKYLGYFLGKRYQRLPRGLVCYFSLNREYWDL